MLLGFLLKDILPHSCRRYVEALRGDKVGEWSGFRFGQYSDDSQLARELIKVLSHVIDLTRPTMRVVLLLSFKEPHCGFFAYPPISIFQRL